jgi:hypothetical protein
MIIGKFIDSIFNLSIIFSSFMLVNTIPYVSSQEDSNNSQAMQLQQMLNQSSPESQKMLLSLLQQEAQQAIREASPEQQELMSQRSQQAIRQASPEQQELIIQQLKQMFPPQLVEKLLPAEKR